MNKKQTREMTNNLLTFVNSYSFKNFCSLYYNKTKQKLESLEQLLDAVASKLVTPEDLFEEHLNHVVFSQEEEDFWLSNLELFEYENYFPPVEKQVNHGTWVKVRTENGYQVHFAKRANRKVNFAETATNDLVSLLNTMKKLNSSKEVVAKKKTASLRSRVVKAIGLQPYEVWYWKTKTQKAYLTPAEYEVVDVEDYVDFAQKKSLKGVVSLRLLYSAENKEKMFYLRSRGLNKERAKFYANMNQCYFEVNMKKAFNEYAEANNKAVAAGFSS